ncbi:MAG: cytochrome-c peroxidase [Campylobacter sp.]|uniref:cytochrome-c peroxidase n=1 Tax=Campylobacter sp. TaxID=205 RepID=UPI003FA0BB9E
MPRAFLQIFSCVLCFFCVQAFAASHVLSPVTQPKFDEQKARLGKELFFDASISPSGTLSCERCHNLYWDLSGTSKKNVKISADEQISPPTALNSALNFIFFKNGEVKELAEQVRQSLTSKNELASEPKFLIQKVNQNSVYKKKFEELYGDGVSFENIVDALVNFEKALVTPNAKFDKFISGDESVFDDEEKRGFELFKKIGCINCHSGKNIGANIYYELKFDKGEGNKTGRYKVPSLRNIEKTAPYFYSGEVMDLKEALKMVAKMRINYDLSDEQTHALYKFLLTLSGEKPEILK